MAHLLEVATGFRGGDPLRPGPGEPKPEYDPAVTTLTSRRRAKVAELKALDPGHARMLGLNAVSYQTLIRWENARRRFGLVGCADDRWLRESGGHPSITGEVREAILAIREETRLRSKVDMRTRANLIHQYVREKYGPDVPVPSYWVLRRVWREWFGPGGARQANNRSADLPEKNGHVLVHRPGQVVALDTTRAAGDGPRGDLRRPGAVPSHPRAGRLHALALRVPAHAGVGHLGRRRDAAARRDDAAADAAGLGPGHGMALPGHARRGGRRVRRAQGGGAAVLHPRDDNHGPWQRPTKVTALVESAAGAGLQHPAREGAAPTRTRLPASGLSG